MTGIECNADLKARIANPSEVESEKAIYEVVLASTKRVFTKRVNVFTPPKLIITEEELGAKVEEILERIHRTMDSFLHGGRSVCGIDITPQMLERAILHIVDRRGHLLMDVRSRAVYFVEEAAQDLQSFLELSPMYAPRRDNEIGDFADSLWRSVSGRRSRACATYRARRRLKRGADEASQNPAFQTPEACPTAADQEKNVPTPSYYTAKEIRTSDRVVSFPRLS